MNLVSVVVMLVASNNGNEVEQGHDKFCRDDGICSMLLVLCCV